jgi:hypothetical protein
MRRGRSTRREYQLQPLRERARADVGAAAVQLRSAAACERAMERHTSACKNSDCQICRGLWHKGHRASGAGEFDVPLGRWTSGLVPWTAPPSTRRRPAAVDTAHRLASPGPAVRGEGEWRASQQELLALEQCRQRAVGGGVPELELAQALAGPNAAMRVRELLREADEQMDRILEQLERRHGAQGGGGLGEQRRPSAQEDVKGWREAWDEKRQRLYYFHKRTQRVVWELPPGVGAPRQSPGFGAPRQSPGVGTPRQPGDSTRSLMKLMLDEPSGPVKSVAAPLPTRRISSSIRQLYEGSA